MTAEDETIARRLSGILARHGGRPGRLLLRSARLLLRSRPSRVALAAEVSGLRGELDRVRERHDEQIARLEELVEELVLTSESLRREIASESRDR
jgi:hypothetical protein